MKQDNPYNNQALFLIMYQIYLGLEKISLFPIYSSVSG